MPRASRPITVTLGKLHQRVEARVRSGAYASTSEVMRAAVRALEREDEAINSYYRQKVQESMADPGPDIPARKVFADLRKYHAKQGKMRAR